MEQGECLSRAERMSVTEKVEMMMDMASELHDRLMDWANYTTDVGKPGEIYKATSVIEKVAAAYELFCRFRYLGSEGDIYVAIDDLTIAGKWRSREYDELDSLDSLLEERQKLPSIENLTVAERVNELLERQREATQQLWNELKSIDGRDVRTRAYGRGVGLLTEWSTTYLEFLGPTNEVDREYERLMGFGETASRDGQLDSSV